MSGSWTEGKLKKIYCLSSEDSARTRAQKVHSFPGIHLSPALAAWEAWLLIASLLLGVTVFQFQPGDSASWFLLSGCGQVISCVGNVMSPNGKWDSGIWSESFTQCLKCRDAKKHLLMVGKEERRVYRSYQIIHTTFTYKNSTRQIIPEIPAFCLSIHRVLLSLAVMKCRQLTEKRD